jgi:polysaccharide export outer membrane protein
LAKLITDKMVSGGYLRDPVVNVEVTQYVSRSVNVAGRVAVPGIVSLDRPYRALEVLLKTGWIREDGANYVYLRRRGQPEMRLATEELVRGDANKDPLLLEGDTLYVPDADKFYIYGQINQPGTFPILPGMTIQQAMAIAGGATATGSTGKVGLVRGSEKEQSVEVTETIQRNDVIIVKERFF